MGADLLVVTLVQPNDTELDWEAALTYVYDAPSEEFPPDPYHWTEGEELRDAWHQGLKELHTSLEHGDRTVVAHEILGHQVWIIGGTSWGDSPSDVWDIAWALTEWPALMDVLGFLPEPWEEPTHE